MNLITQTFLFSNDQSGTFQKSISIAFTIINDRFYSPLTYSAGCSKHEKTYQTGFIFDHSSLGTTAMHVVYSIGKL